MRLTTKVNNISKGIQKTALRGTNPIHPRSPWYNYYQYLPRLRMKGTYVQHSSGRTK